MTFAKENIGELLREAVSRRDIMVYYQPKFDAITSKLVGAEALSRWRKADGGLYSPAEFIPPLEETGLVNELDWYVYEEVCGFLGQLLRQNMNVVTISVNFSRTHASEADFVKRLCATADRCRVPHSFLEVEITESALVHGGKDIIRFISEIRSEGFDVAIDDFGSGLSSLSFVKDVPANILKIDKSLLSGNCENEKERIVLESVFDFAHRLKLTTVAEGVETPEQLGFLRTCDCKIIQGFLYAKPMPRDNFFELCATAEAKRRTEDILLTQAPASATQLLLEAVFTRFPLIIMSNLTRNSFYMMGYENFTTSSCPSTGIYTDLIAHAAMTMHPDDRDLFRETFNRERQIEMSENGEKVLSVITRQLGDDGIYRRVETSNYFVKNPSVDDVLAITLSRPLEAVPEE